MDKQQDVEKAGFPIMLLLIGLGIASLFTYVFLEIADDVLDNEVEAFDATIISFFKAIESGALDQFFIFVTELGSVWFLTTLTLAIIFTLWFKLRDKWGILFFVLAIGGGGLLTTIFKHYYGRERPSINPDIDAIGFSFPSGHSMGSLIFYGFVVYLIGRTMLSKTMKWIFAGMTSILVLCIGLSRIYLGAHFPSDVFSGFLAGAVWLTVCILALEYVYWRGRSEVGAIRSVSEFLRTLLNKMK